MKKLVLLLAFIIAVFSLDNAIAQQGTRGTTHRQDTTMKTKQGKKGTMVGKSGTRTRGTKSDTTYGKSGRTKQGTGKGARMDTTKTPRKKPGTGTHRTGGTGKGSGTINTGKGMDTLKPKPDSRY